MSKQWKYLVVKADTGMWGTFKPEDLQEQLDKHGRLGWELVNVVHAMPASSSPTLVFKQEQ
jgi:hypothetical protein